MALRGWRLFGLAGTIVVYIGGILFLSFVSLQNPQQKRNHGRGYSEFETLRNRDLGLLGKKPPLQWCSELRYMDSPPPAPKVYRLLETFPGHFVKKHQPGSSNSLPDSTEGIHNQKRHNDVNLDKHKRFASSLSSAAETSSASYSSQWPNSNNNKFNNKLADSGRIVNDRQLPAPKSSTRKLTALVSFPGSGNTWLRYLLQQATGILTGSVYKDYGLLKSGFPAENVANSSVLVIKTHEWGPNAWAPYGKAILLIRDPKKAILAEFNRQSGGHVGFASPDRYRRTKGRYWTQFVKNKLWAWEQTNLSWAKNFTGEVKLVFYDELVENVEGTLRSILRFLKFPVNEELLSCALMRKEGIYRRKKRILQFDPYSPAMHVAIDEKRIEVYAALGRSEPN
ncbi:WSCD family member AAEL009094 [Malaya genurostris]|uniref:WSCD family member AAEL009094 n=1 Tax=Malaya genurostris TaxID=325434 RepID=UPI0026F3E5BA|nr:WSCD family member AAEL009094 [Malaya genurostris]XP_058445633.1 WSCD family member AAEL009094 [Malaya genurostris]XP_058445634.1 WSCD family member AAEL009094 [Malaya genurostris]XP_058445635.1 WSCD family member AAEL009094 [Malaya genurostris]XP_058445636.1 WSCD family member AAEL009094 [Malaya genurostris]XP_058445637.1 WSCD family member AAEL009094 [Malaya genurostris]